MTISIFKYIELINNILLKFDYLFKGTPLIIIQDAS